MRANPLATWELRIENLRVYYLVEGESEPTVFIHAIGVKGQDRVYIAGEEAQL
jgi:hypothetical protein